MWFNSCWVILGGVSGWILCWTLRIIEGYTYLVGGLEHLDCFSIYCEFHHPNWRTHIFQWGWNHQPVTDRLKLCLFAPDHSEWDGERQTAGSNLAFWLENRRLKNVYILEMLLGFPLKARVVLLQSCNSVGPWPRPWLYVVKYLIQGGAPYLATEVNIAKLYIKL